jgi:chromosome segregation ATPase
MDRKEITKKFIRQLKEWEPEIEELKAAAIKARDNAQKDFLKHLDEYKEKEKNLLKKLEALEKASDEALKDLIKGLETVINDLRQTFQKMSSHFK